MKKTIQTPSRWLLWVLVSLLFAVPVSAQVVEATVRIDGMI